VVEKIGRAESYPLAQPTVWVLGESSMHRPHRARAPIQPSA